MDFQNKSILVTGGAGAIGCNLVRALLKEGCARIIVLDDLSSGYKKNLPNASVEFIHGSIIDESILKKVFSEPVDIIFHLAAHFANQNSVEHPEQDLLVNGLGTLKMLQYAVRRGVGKFLYASSSCVYGNAKGPIAEETPFSLDTPYAISKALGERYVRFFHDFHRLDTVIVRYFNSFGPGERPGKYRNAIPNFIDAALSGQSLTITGDGSETRDFNYIDNTVNGTLLAALSAVSSGKIYNIGSGKETAIRDVAERINHLTGNTAPILFKERRAWDHVIARVADISKAKADFGYEPAIDLEKQFKETIDWLKNKQIC